MRPFKNHFGMVMSTIIAIVLSLLMSTFAIILDGKIFGDPGVAWTWQGAIKNWGTCYLIITLTGWIFPLTEWSFKLCDKWHIAPGTTKHALVENTVASLFFNFFATVILSAVNMFGNPALEGAVQAGAIPSVAFVWYHTVLRDLVICFVFSFIVAWFLTKFALKVAVKASKANIEHELAAHGPGFRNANNPVNEAMKPSDE